jgi:YegS/Rv2252/BmrU family lipid kinase
MNRRVSLLVVNTRSRQGRASLDAVVERLESDGERLIVERPQTPQALVAAIRARCGQVGRVIVGGGDGTLNLAAAPVLDCGVPLGIVPLGTANDLARTLGIPGDLAGAVEVLRRGLVRRIDLGQVNGHYFFNVASIGLGPRVTERLTSEAKSRLGPLEYPRALISAYREHRPFHARVSVDDTTRWVRTMHLAVGNGRFYGGGAAVYEDAAIDDGRLDLFSLAPRPLWQLVLLAPWLRKGRHRPLRAVEMLHGTRARVETRRPMPVSADGEVLAETPAEFGVLPGILPVIAARTAGEGRRK